MGFFLTHIKVRRVPRPQYAPTICLTQNNMFAIRKEDEMKTPPINEAIIEARKEYIRKHGVKPQTIRIAADTVQEIEQLGPGVIGQELFTAICTQGADAFADRAIFGMRVEVVEALPSSFILVEPDEA